MLLIRGVLRRPRPEALGNNSQSVFTHIRSMDDRPPPSRFSSLRSMYGMVPYAVVSLRLFGSEDSIVIVLAILLWRGPRGSNRVTFRECF